MAISEIWKGMMMVYVGVDMNCIMMVYMIVVGLYVNGVIVL